MKPVRVVNGFPPKRYWEISCHEKYSSSAPMLLNQLIRGTVAFRCVGWGIVRANTILVCELLHIFAFVFPSSIKLDVL